MVMILTFWTQNQAGKEEDDMYCYLGPTVRADNSDFDSSDSEEGYQNIEPGKLVFFFEN